MASTTSIAVAIRSTTTSRTPSFPPFPSKNFVCSPGKHGLPRTGLDAISDQSRFSAVMDALAYQVQILSLSEPSTSQATASIGSSVHTETPNRTESISVDTSLRHKLSENRFKVLYKCTQSIRAGLKKAALKRGDRSKKSGGASSRPPSQCWSQADPLVGQTIESTSWRSVVETSDVNQHPQVPGSYQMVSDVQDTTSPRVTHSTSPPPIYFDSAPSNSLPAASTTGDWNEPADIPMNDNVLSPSPLPTSPAPIPMELEVGTPSSNSTQVPSSPRTPLEPSTSSQLEPSVSEPADTLMREGDSESHETELVQQIQSASQIFIDSIFPQNGSTSLGQDIEMKSQDESTNFTPLGPTSTPSVQPTEVISAPSELEGTSKMDISRGSASTSAPTPTIIANQEGDQAQALPNSRFDTAPPSEQPAEVAQVAQDEETSATQPRVAAPLSPGSVSTSTETAASTSPLPVASPSPTATSSTTGPTTPTLSSRSDLTPEGQPTQTHAARLHQVLGKWGLSKQASRSSQPAASDAEEAEALAFFADLKKKAAAQLPVKEKSKPAPLPSPSGPKPTKGSAARSLMDDIMAGFGLTKPKPSQQQAPAVAHPPTRPAPAATNYPRSSLVVQGPSPVGAGRQTGSRSAQPHYIGNGSEVSAPSGSIPTCRAPSVVPIPSKVSGPSGRVPAATPSETVPRKAASEPSTTITGGGQSGQERAIKGTRRVARAVMKTGLTWQIVQQRAREAQAASDLDQVDAAAQTKEGSSGRDSTQSSESLEDEPNVKRRCL